MGILNRKKEEESKLRSREPSREPDKVVESVPAPARQTFAEKRADVITNPDYSEKYTPRYSPRDMPPREVPMPGESEDIVGKDEDADFEEEGEMEDIDESNEGNTGGTVRVSLDELKVNYQLTLHDIRIFFMGIQLQQATARKDEFLLMLKKDGIERILLDNGLKEADIKKIQEEI